MGRGVGLGQVRGLRQQYGSDLYEQHPRSRQHEYTVDHHQGKDEGEACMHVRQHSEPTTPGIPVPRLPCLSCSLPIVRTRPSTPSLMLALAEGDDDGAESEGEEHLAILFDRNTDSSLGTPSDITRGL